MIRSGRGGKEDRDVSCGFPCAGMALFSFRLKDILSPDFVTIQQIFPPPSGKGARGEGRKQ
jgi:hypothetical protein